MVNKYKCMNIYKKIICDYLGFHKWKWFRSDIPFVVIYKCENCGKTKEDYQGQ